MEQVVEDILENKYTLVAEIASVTIEVSEWLKNESKKIFMQGNSIEDLEDEIKEVATDLIKNGSNGEINCERGYWRAWCFSELWRIEGSEETC